jgi:hypothetical protein
MYATIYRPSLEQEVGRYIGLVYCEEKVTVKTGFRL